MLGAYEWEKQRSRWKLNKELENYVLLSIKVKHKSVTDIQSDGLASQQKRWQSGKEVRG